MLDQDKPPREPRLDDNLFSLLNLAWIGQAAFVAAKLGVADLLLSGPKTIDELARSTGTDPTRLHQVMRALAGFEIFALDGEGRYRLTQTARSLTRGRAAWLRNYAVFWGEQLYPASGKMFEMLKSGTCAFDLAYGTPIYEHYKAMPQARSLFVDFMSAVTDWHAEVLVKAIDFQSHRHVVDVGGGTASLMTAILRNNPHLHGTIFDQPVQADFVSERIRLAGVGDRCSFVGGSFLESVPQGGDLYLIKHVLHDWPDADVAMILKNIGLAMSRESTLMIVEGVLDERNGVDRLMKLQDLERMISTGGKVRTRDEFQALLHGAGLRLLDVRRTSLVDGCLIIARKN
jgi:hypothetical protein